MGLLRCTRLGCPSKAIVKSASEIPGDWTSDGKGRYCSPHCLDVIVGDKPDIVVLRRSQESDESILERIENQRMDRAASFSGGGLELSIGAGEPVPFDEADEEDEYVRDDLRIPRKGDYDVTLDDFDAEDFELGIQGPDALESDFSLEWDEPDPYVEGLHNSQRY